MKFILREPETGNDIPSVCCLNSTQRREGLAGSAGQVKLNQEGHAVLAAPRLRG